MDSSSVLASYLSTFTGGTTSAEARIGVRLQPHTKGRLCNLLYVTFSHLSPAWITVGCKFFITYSLADNVQDWYFILDFEKRLKGHEQTELALLLTDGIGGGSLTSGASGGDLLLTRAVSTAATITDLGVQICTLVSLGTYGARSAMRSSHDK